MTARTLSLADHAVLTFLIEGTAATHHIAKAAGIFEYGAAEGTARARRRLRRLEIWGFVEGVSAPDGGSVFWWKITDEGRKAVRP